MILPSNNPVLDELDRLSPEAKGALAGAHQSVVAQQPPALGTGAPQPPTPMPAGPAPAPATTPAPTAQPSPHLINPAPVPTLTPDAQQQSHRAEVNRLEDNGSGISQIHSPWARIPLQIADAVGGAFLPGLEHALPGTQGHNQDLIQRAKARVTNDESLLNGQQKRGLEAAQTSAQASTPEFRAGQVQNKADQVQATKDLGTAKIDSANDRAMQHFKSSLAKDGYTVDENGDPRPMKPEEMSDPAQAKLALTKAQKDAQNALADYHKAQAAGEPQQIALRRAALEIANRNADTAAQNASMRQNDQEFKYKGTVHGEAPVGTVTTESGTPVAGVNAAHAMPTGAQRTKADLAKSVDLQVQTMQDILDRRKKDMFGPGNGRKTNFELAIGNNDKDALVFKAAADFISEHAAGMFGSRSSQVIRELQSLNDPHFNPESLEASLGQFSKTSAEFKKAGTPHLAGMTENGPKKVANKAEYDALPSGTEYIGPDGIHARKK